MKGKHETETGAAAPKGRNRNREAVCQYSAMRPKRMVMIMKIQNRPVYIQCNGVLTPQNVLLVARRFHIYGVSYSSLLVRFHKIGIGLG